MNLQDLRYVVALAEARHFARAAITCHVSQPTLSTASKKARRGARRRTLRAYQQACHLPLLGERSLPRHG
jgi:DNA-binding transcriptional LysR family regulator